MSGDAVQTVTFTCAFTVNYTIGGDTLEHSFNDTATFRVVAAPVPYWASTLTTAQFADAASLTDTQIRMALEGGAFNDFVSPFTTEYNGGTTAAQLHAALYVPQSDVITSVRSEGFVLDFDTHNVAAASRTLYVTRFPLSVGPHNITWRTS